MKNFIIMGMAVFGVFIIFGVAWLMHLNKWSWTIWSKIIPPTAIGLVAIFFTLYFSLKGEKFVTRFNYTLYFNKIDKEPLDSHYPKSQVYGGRQFDIGLNHFIDNHLDERKLSNIEFEKNNKKIVEFYSDITYLKLLSRLFWIYADSWDVYINSVRQGDSFTTMVTRHKPEPLFTLVKWSDLFDINNDAYDLFKMFSDEFRIKEMKLPPGTQINFDKQKNTLSFKNPFVEGSIVFRMFGGSLGLGDYKWFLNYDDKKERGFWSVHYEIICTYSFVKVLFLL